MLDLIVNTIFPLPPQSLEKLERIIEEVTHPKGFVLLRSGKIENSIYLLRKGIVRAYAHYEGNEITFWFGKEGDAILSMRSYVEGKEGYEDIELLENCELYKMDFEPLQQLYKEDIHIANWGRKLAEKELIKAEDRLISSQSKSATERYRELLTDHADLLKRVQLTHIASYLGITPVSLSRIRAEL